MKEAGYSLEVNLNGGITLSLSDGKEKASLNSTQRINDGLWHHLIAEVDRSSKVMTMYIDGKRAGQGKGISPETSIDNSSDLFVGGSPEGNCFNGTIDFLRICLGTLKDAKTDIDELYTWEFNGPALKDFTGKQPIGRRDAGALEKTKK
jgi:hypothetical protein